MLQSNKKIASAYVEFFTKLKESA